MNLSICHLGCSEYTLVKLNISFLASLYLEDSGVVLIVPSHAICRSRSTFVTDYTDENDGEGPSRDRPLNHFSLQRTLYNPMVWFHLCLLIFPW